MDALNALATELATEAAPASFSESSKGEANDDQSKGGDFSIDSIFVDLQRDLQKQIAQFGFKNSFTNTSLLESDAISHDAVAFSVFKSTACHQTKRSVSVLDESAIRSRIFGSH